MPRKTSQQNQNQKQGQNVKIVINEDKKPAKRKRRAYTRRSAQPIERYTTPEQRLRMMQTYAPPSVSYINNAPNSEIIN